MKLVMAAGPQGNDRAEARHRRLVNYDVDRRHLPPLSSLPETPPEALSAEQVIKAWREQDETPVLVYLQQFVLRLKRRGEWAREPIPRRS
jgi:hypothetical protein